MIKILFTIVIIYVILIIIFEGYYRSYPSIPIYPNNFQDLEIMKKEMNNRKKNDIDFFFKTNKSVVYAFLPFVDDKLEDLIKISSSQNNIIFFFKNLINRRRPYQIDKNLVPLSTKTSRTPAYPAGHAYQALLVAKYLSNKYPEKKKLFNDIAFKCDDCRVKAGIHYRSDGDFSRKIFKYFN